MLAEVVEELLVIVELGVPLTRLRVSKVVAERNQKNRGAKETGLLAVLIQQEEGPEGTDASFSHESQSKSIYGGRIWLRPLVTSPSHSAL